MPDFSNVLQRDEDGNWAYDDGKIQAVFTPEELEQLFTPTPLTDEAICEVAEGMKAGIVLTSEQSPANLFGSVWMVMMFMDPKHLAEMALKDITLLYEFTDKAGPRTINGYPSFFSCRMMNRDDHKRLHEKLVAIGVIDGKADCEPSTRSDRFDGCNLG